ncbi:2-C-methyl-D-erythritol 4-phosphate cytidylyltransferase (plasmid) [Leuconostoc carnosum]|uniref:2-C-methyl-D-erythritol 4-phosphate cytidylyltransferase n=1 Tax=Leuconostoc carnosum TaxID=1252 RepID=A0AAE6M3M0_LEUCA|nr:IspD/TarI family cytidylyltransferase [Leuconostoc carnosum]QEA34129.1 2-C-methyl-D-erythritol 4-phosphate cytidylyltransferase [Leuconostoc carnosum]
MNIGVIFAGGVGMRMHTRGIPKQFLKVNGKPIIVHTVEIFENTSEIDAVVVVVPNDSMPLMANLVSKFNLSKVRNIVSGGNTGQLSIFSGLKAAKKMSNSEKDIVIIHDGVRPLINGDVINNNIQSVKEKGSAITVAPAKETLIIVNNDQKIESVLARDKSRIAKAPQSFYLHEILDIEEKAIASGKNNFVDSSTLMAFYGKKLFTVEGPYENIKITTPDDFYMFKALFDARENAQIFGI